MTDPQTKLEVGGSNLSNYIRVSSIGTRPNGIEFVRAGSAGDWRWQNSNASFDLYSVTNDFVSAGINDIIATFSNEGRLGLGNIDPMRSLDVVGASEQFVRLTSTSSSATGIEFIRQGGGGDWKWQNANGFFDLYYVTNDFSSSSISDVLATFTESGRLGIGTTSPQEELHVAGTIRSNDLAGTGERMVAANASGDLVVATPKTEYLVLNGIDFRGQLVTGVYAYSLNEDETLWASVDLPHGAVVQSVYLQYSDNSSAEDLKFELRRYNVPDGGHPTYGGFTNMTFLQTTGQPGTALELTLNSISNPVIDNLNHTYAIALNDSPGHNWTGISTNNVRIVRIAYTVPN